MTIERKGELANIVLAVLFVGGLIAASLWVLRPFLGAFIWAVMVVIPTWQLMLGVQRWAGGRRWVAAAVMSGALLLILLVPLFGAIGTILTHLDDFARWAKELQEFKLPAPPAWLVGLPLVGERAADLWRQAATEGLEPLAAEAAPYARDAVQFFASKIGDVGALFITFLLTVVGTAVLYIRGEKAADAALRFGNRLAGRTGERMIRLSAQAIRGVALGVVVTALLQAAIGGLGLFIAGVPGAALITAVIFLFAVAQIGGGPVLVVPVLWLYWTDHPGWGTFLLFITVITATIDNVVRPILIKRGADLPLLLIFIGVIGGLIGFGLIGIFVGPVVLAVSYTLLRVWLGLEETKDA